MSSARDGPALVLAALPQELDPVRAQLRDAGCRVALTGVGQRRAADATRRLARDARLLISTGCCGGLVPGASAGMLAVPGRVLGPDATEAPPPDPELRALARSTVERLGLHCSERPLITVDRPASTPEAKRSLHRRSGAVAVDMETAAIAREAATLGLPYLALRVVLDSVEETLPDAGVLDAEGRLQPRRLLSAMRSPRALLSMAGLRLRLRTRCDGLGRSIAALLAQL